jgi:3-hydroxyacyl-CoA dehydrogenase/enoyl-CoA hydratase/3-hydroxybutyryl-CoA epimerase
VPEVLPALVGTFAVGRKVGKGFYKYKNGAQASPNKEVLTLRPRSPAAEPSRDEIEQRLILLMINEGARCLEEGIVGSAGDVDLAMVMGTGFAPFRGGPLRYADSIAVIKVVEDLSRYAQSAGAHYEPCALLREMAKSGKRFYED